MSSINWIKDLVKAEQRMEETGVIDISGAFDVEEALTKETHLFMYELKNGFVESANAFNELKSSALGRVKIYGIAQTQSDFMLFRNSFKMIFSMKAPGVVSIRFNFMSANHIPHPNVIQTASATPTTLMDEHIIDARWGAFGELFWTYKNVPVKEEYIVKHHMTLFIKESAK